MTEKAGSRLNGSDRQGAVAYYDEHAVAKLRAFADGNARVERAWDTVLKWTPGEAARVCEIGCGIGAISWRISRHFKQAHVLGLDISPKSIELASRLFGSERLEFALIDGIGSAIPTRTDLVLLMDVYEHIPVGDRPALHGALRDTLSPDGRIIMSFPTPRNQAALREHGGEIQPVDEDVCIEDILEMVRATDTELVHYSEVDIWDPGDYAHVVLARRSDRSAPLQLTVGCRPFLGRCVGARLRRTRTSRLLRRHFVLRRLRLRSLDDSRVPSE
jgi:trans-aconitate methyltransferase